MGSATFFLFYTVYFLSAKEVIIKSNKSMVKDLNEINFDSKHLSVGAIFRHLVEMKPLNSD